MSAVRCIFQCYWRSSLEQAVTILNILRMRMQCSFQELISGWPAVAQRVDRDRNFHVWLPRMLKIQESSNLNHFSIPAILQKP